MSNTLSDEVKAFLNEPRFAVLATQHANGTIQQTVMWYELRDNVIMMNTLAGRVKDGNLRRSPNASICVENGYQFVTINGTVDFDEDVQTARDDIYALARRYNPDFKDGENFYADQSDNFFVGNAFPTCGINFTAQEIMGQTKENQ